MKSYFPILALLLCLSCSPAASQEPSSSAFVPDCPYAESYASLGNRLRDTLLLDGRWIDPIDDTSAFVQTQHGFYQSDDKVFKKAWAAAPCQGKLMQVGYFQDLSAQIDLATYRAYNDRYFTSRDQVFFWWVNSGGHLVIPIPGAEARSFVPFPDLCGGKDRNGVYYGSPNFGVNQLFFSPQASFRFVPKANHYWNDPHHYVVLGEEIYEILWDHEQGYHCQKRPALVLTDIE
ncbi:MAG: hypothetical protein AAFR61_12705 [Bacteroidota bacterium]